ncbi:MAG: hypothetical protein OEY14_10655 [Myxococcales bacterium]|nr:hypothetical protein [Myxococcales bacterium]
MSQADPRPLLIISMVLDSGARAASMSRELGTAYERALAASAGHEIAGVEPVELHIRSKEFDALRRPLGLSTDRAAFYELFPLPAKLSPEVRKVAGQFLAADVLWALEGQGLLGGVPLNVKLDLPKGWVQEPKALHERLLAAGALELSPEGISTFNAIKSAWDALPAS